MKDVSWHHPTPLFFFTVKAKVGVFEKTVSYNIKYPTKYTPNIYRKHLAH